MEGVIVMAWKKKVDTGDFSFIGTIKDATTRGGKSGIQECCHYHEQQRARFKEDASRVYKETEWRRGYNNRKRPQHERKLQEDIFINGLRKAL